MLMEHSTSAVNWQPRNVAKESGEMQRNSLCHIARGADAALFFQWRASRSGAEKFHSAMVPHAGTGSGQWHELVRLGAAVNRTTQGEFVDMAVEAFLVVRGGHGRHALAHRPCIDTPGVRANRLPRTATRQPISGRGLVERIRVLRRPHPERVAAADHFEGAARHSTGLEQ